MLFIDVDPEPALGTSIYEGPRGWIPNIALKRRFRLNNITETDLFATLDDFFTTHAYAFGITFTQVVQPHDMPVEVLEVKKVPSLMSFHRDLIAFLGDKIESRYPERDGANYYPHMTLTWRGKRVVDPTKFLPEAGKIGTRSQHRVCLVKDPTDNESARVLHYFDSKN